MTRGKLLTPIALATLLVAFPPQTQAHGWGGGWGGGWRGGGFSFSFPIAPYYYYPPPVYYAPPPAYYAPPPGYYAPYPGYIAQSPAAAPQAAPNAPAQSCNAGSYVCPMEVTVPVGANCYCRGNNGNRVYGAAQ